MHKGIVPYNALSNGLWIGEVPDVLKKLSFVEKLLVARVHHNCCFVKVSMASSGHPEIGPHKMISHVISFESPVAKIYDVLPPPCSDLDEVLAILFTGPNQPTEDDLKCTPLLVCHNIVMNALTWLCHKHVDYRYVKISTDNLNQYTNNSAPVEVIYQHSLTNKVPEGTSVYDISDADGTEVGAYPVVVHGIVGKQLPMTDIKTQKSLATRHFKGDNGVLAIGHAEHPQSIYNNTSLYPSMFPWLFPYGLGGIGTTVLSDAAHKKWLMMYHDKWFQVDINFPFVAFSHEQVKASTTAGFLLVKKDKFHNIANRISNLDEAVLENVSTCLSNGESVIPTSQAEKDCFQLFNDLDHVAYKVQGSLTSKKYMHNEMYSLMAAEGAPS